MRTTLDLNDALLARAKVAAARERTTLTRLIEEGLSLRLEPTRPPPAAEPSPLPVFYDGTGLAADIDPLSNRSLLDAADEADLAAGRLR
ncbi:hypothetical protein BH23GEM3_BH23GEM3_05630 [soil metagenome]|nr:DUF2191 domain-containing protein [Gemmatimonadota bacterium]